ncbi:MAG: type II/IV secretion system protein [Candidatus Harrisonbacteria bacterium]|nr:type II/IV secretion system protein [Candidatus Harrisonbacteria bacterium]
MANVIDEKLAAMRREAEERDAERRAAKLNLRYIDLAKSPFQVDALKFVPEDDARRAKVAVINAKGRHLMLAAYDGAAGDTQDIVQRLQGDNFDVEVVIGSLSGLAHLWESYKYLPKEAAQITGKVVVTSEAMARARAGLQTLPSVRSKISAYDPKTGATQEVLDTILLGALMHHASDVHFETEETVVRLRYRVDGLLHDVMADFPRPVYAVLLSRIKLLSTLKLNVTSEPQDGRFSLVLPEGKEIEIRASTIPSEFGETVVLRVLYQDALRMSLNSLGLRDDDLAIVEEELKEPNGMILNTGPTGAGKTTTLYVFLRHKQSPEVKIITIEDPIEYHLEGIEQTQVDRSAGYDFASGLHSIMRQDPDVILVGEINDKETADIGIQAALTGHLVFSTIHANDAPGAIPRLIDLGVKPSSIGPALNLVIAQRLLRRLCAECKVAEPLLGAMKTKIKKFLASLPSRVKKPALEIAALFAPKGCDVCGGIGYRGRVGVYELFRIDDAVEKAINTDPSEAHLRELAEKQGMTTMQEDGILKVLEGVTTFEEVQDATGHLKW